MFNIKTETIRERSTNGPTYMKGRNYYKNGHIRQIDYDPDRNIVQAIVAGTQTYQVIIILTAAGDLHDATCTCSAFSSYWGFCQHITAVLLYCSDNFGKKKTFTRSKADKSVRKIIKDETVLTGRHQIAGSQKTEKSTAADSRRKNRAHSREFRQQLDRIVALNQKRPRRLIKLQTTLHCSTTSTLSPWLTFSIGSDAMFPVTNMEQFARSLALNQNFESGQNWTYNPLTHVFSDQVQPLIDLIIDAFENDYKAVFSTSHTAGKEGCLYLNSNRFAQFLRISRNLPDVCWQPIKSDSRFEVIVQEKDLPLEIHLLPEKSGEFICLQVRCGNSCQQMTASRNIFLVDGEFFLPDRKNISVAEPIINVYQSPGSHQILLTPSEAGDLIGQYLPMIKKICQVEIHPDITRRIVGDPLVIEAAFDLEPQGIRADLAYRYGAAVLTSQKQDSGFDNQLILRDYSSESDFEELLTGFGFNKRGNHWLLDRNQEIFNFMDFGRSELAEHAVIRESDSLRGIQVLPAPEPRFDLQMDELTDALVMQIDWDGLEQEEHPAYMQALAENRSWFQNRNGNFRKVNLSARESLTEFFNLLSLWNMREAASSEKLITLPRYRALALSGIKGHFLRVDESVHDMISHLSDPARLSFRLPSGLKTTLRPYQRHGFQWLCTLHHYRLGGILADDMGLGKTLQTIAFTAWLYRRTKRPSLIIAPTSLIYNWQSEFSRFMPDLPVMIIDGSRQQRAQRISELKNQACLITSYALLRRDIDDISEIQFASCFLDEAQNIKNPDTLNARSVKQIRRDCAFALTGTPIENNLSELWSIFDFVMPGYLLDHRHFQDVFEIPVQRDQRNDILTLLHEQIRPFVLRRMKKDVLRELPDKIQSTIICDMTDEQRKIYETFLHQAGLELENEISSGGFNRSQIYILALLTRLRQICCHPGLFINNYMGGSGKIQLLQELMQDCVYSGHRILLFSQFTHMLELISRQWQQSGFEKPLYIDGQVSAEERLSLVERFNQGEGNLFLVSLRAGGTGLNLTGADTVIHYDPWWNPAVEEQATDRAYRIGQENVVQVIRLFTRNSIEEKIMQLQLHKKQLMDAVIKPGQNLLSKMTLDEVRALFQG
jgi:hypothetical protein